MRIRKLAVLAALASMLPFTAAGGQVEVLGVLPGPSAVVGTVVDAGSGQAVPAADVALRDGGGSVVVVTVSEDDGSFRIHPPGPGEYTLEVSRIGFETLSGDLAFESEGSMTLRIGLRLRPVEVEGLSAEARARPRNTEMSFAGFEARRKMGKGTFFDEADIVRRKPSRLTDLVSRAPGLTVMRDGGRPVDVIMLRNQGGFRGSRPCFPEIWLDGLRIREGGYDVSPGRSNPAGSFLNDVIPPEQVAGIEVYAGISQIPAQFNRSTAMCGVVVLWSRR